MGIVVTHDMFVATVFELVGNEYEVLGTYEKAKIKIKIKHNKCGHEYSVTPDNFKRGQRCPNCVDRRKQAFDIDIFKKSVYELTKDEYTVLGEEYVNARTPIKMKHNTCGYEWDVLPYHFKGSGTRCPKCADKRIGMAKRKNQEDFNKEVAEITDNEYEVVGEYINAITKIDILHKSCNKLYNVEPNAFLNGNRCAHCKPSISKGEKAISDFLESKNIKYLSQYSFDDCRNKNPLPFDFVLISNDEIKTIIEFDGRHHYEPIDLWGGEEEFKRTVLCDNIKNEYCKNKGIKLVRIPYWDFDKINEILNDLDDLY